MGTFAGGVYVDTVGALLWCEAVVEALAELADDLTGVVALTTDVLSVVPLSGATPPLALWLHTVDEEVALPVWLTAALGTCAVQPTTKVAATSHTANSLLVAQQTISIAPRSANQTINHPTTIWEPLADVRRHALRSC